MTITDSLIIAAQQHLREQGFTGRYGQGEQSWYDVNDVLYDWVLSDDVSDRIRMLMEDAAVGRTYDDLADDLTGLLV